MADTQALIERGESITRIRHRLLALATAPAGATQDYQQETARIALATIDKLVALFQGQRETLIVRND